MNHDIPTRLETRARLRETARDTDCAGPSQRARYPDDWHPHEYYMKRVRLFACLAAIGLVGAVVWMVGL